MRNYDFYLVKTIELYIYTDNLSKTWFIKKRELCQMQNWSLLAWIHTILIQLENIVVIDVVLWRVEHLTLAPKYHLSMYHETRSWNGAKLRAEELSSVLNNIIEIMIFDVSATLEETRSPSKRIKLSRSKKNHISVTVFSCFSWKQKIDRYVFKNAPFDGIISMWHYKSTDS